MRGARAALTVPPVGLVRVLTVDTDGSVLIDLRDHPDHSDGSVTIDLTSSTIAEADEVAGLIRPSLVVVELRKEALSTFALVARLHRSHPSAAVIAVAPARETRLASFAVMCGAKALVDASRRAEELPIAMAAVLRGERWFSPLLLDDLVREVRVLASGVAGVVTDRLSPREREVVRLAAKGLGYPAIARALQIAPRTVRSHVRNIAHKFDATSGRDLLDVVGAIGKELAEDEDSVSGPGDAEAPPRQEAGRPPTPEAEA